MKILLLLLALVACESEAVRERVRDEVRQTTLDALDEAIAKYEFMYENSAQPVELCLQSGIVVHLNAEVRFAESYRAWAKVRDRDCRRAGLGF